MMPRLDPEQSVLEMMLTGGARKATPDVTLIEVTLLRTTCDMVVVVRGER
jgi:hypothetical protein